MTLETLKFSQKISTFVIILSLIKGLLFITFNNEEEVDENKQKTKCYLDLKDTAAISDYVSKLSETEVDSILKKILEENTKTTQIIITSDNSFENKRMLLKNYLSIYPYIKVDPITTYILTQDVLLRYTK